MGAFEDPPANGGGKPEYVQDIEPASPEVGERWQDTSTDPHEVYIYDGATWLSTTVNDHTEVGNVQPGQHFNAGNALSFSTGALNVIESNIDYTNLKNTLTKTDNAKSQGPLRDRITYLKSNGNSVSIGSNNTYTQTIGWGRHTSEGLWYDITVRSDASSYALDASIYLEVQTLTGSWQTVKSWTGLSRGTDLGSGEVSFGPRPIQQARIRTVNNTNAADNVDCRFETRPNVAVSHYHKT